MTDRLRMIEQMLETNPEDSFLRYCAALEYRKRGDNVRATEILEALVMHDPDYLASYYQLGKMLEEQGKADRAIKQYQAGKEIARKKNDSKTYGELSEALMLLDVFEE